MWINGDVGIRWGMGEIYLATARVPFELPMATQAVLPPPAISPSSMIRWKALSRSSRGPDFWALVGSLSWAIRAMEWHRPCEKWAESMPESAQPPTPSATPKATLLLFPMLPTKKAS